MADKDPRWARNETLRTIANRRSIRVFKDQPITDHDRAALLHAANAAPSAHNQQSWRFIVIRGESKRNLVDLVSSRAADFPKPSSALLRMASRSIASAPLAVAVANTGDLIAHGTELFKVEKDLGA